MKASGTIKSLVIVLPVYNEENDLRKNLPILHAFATENLLRYEWRIVIAEQASTDNTAAIAEQFSRTYPRVSFLHRGEKGRGGALKEAWQYIDADYYSYTDIDLSSQLRYLPELFQALDENYAISIGSRLSQNSKVVGRTITREVMSRSYNFIIRILFRVRFRDAQCGFKAIKKEVVKKIIPHIQNNNWFFDSELLIIAEKAKFPIKVVPIEWRDDPESTVRVLKTAREDISGLMRIFFTRPWKFVAPPSVKKNAQ